MRSRIQSFRCAWKALKNNYIFDAHYKISVEHLTFIISSDRRKSKQLVVTLKYSMGKTFKTTKKTSAQWAKQTSDVLLLFWSIPFHSVLRSFSSEGKLKQSVKQIECLQQVVVGEKQLRSFTLCFNIFYVSRSVVAFRRISFVFVI